MLATTSPLLLAPLTLAPQAELPLLYVTDTLNDQVHRLADANGDGTYLDPGDISVFYDDTLGPFELSNNNGIAVDNSGLVYVSDTELDRIIVLEDLDHDGSCHGPGEARLFYDDTNQEGLEIPAANDMSFAGRRLWVATDNGNGAPAALLWLEDLNRDGDALDVGESKLYHMPFPGASTPQDIRVGRDGRVYWLDQVAAAPGIWALEDLNGDGCADVGEVRDFFFLPSQPLIELSWGMYQDYTDSWYLMDTENDLIWRARDDNGDTRISIGESDLIWQGFESSKIWEIQANVDGSIYAAETQNTDRILRMFDADLDGIINPITEVVAVYDEILASIDIGNPRSLAIDRNRGAFADRYCTANANSTGRSAAIDATGSRSVTWNDLRISAAPVPPGQNGIFFYGPETLALPFGNGFRCVASGTTGIARLPATQADAAGGLRWSMDYEAPPTASTSITPGSTWHFQAWYRDPAGGGSNFNLSDALSLTFLP